MSGAESPVLLHCNHSLSTAAPDEIAGVPFATKASRLRKKSLAGNLSESYARRKR